MDWIKCVQLWNNVFEWSQRPKGDCALNKQRNNIHAEADINSDDGWRKWFQVSVVICMAGATIGIASQYFGDPIRW